MMNHTPSIHQAGLGCAAMLSGTVLVFADEPAPLKYMDSGIHDLITGYRPNPIRLETKAPAEVKKAPEGLKKPQYGTFRIGPEKSAATITVLLDFEDETPVKLWVDGNANGDLTDDGGVELKSTTHERPDGTKSTTHSAKAMVTIPFASGPKPGRLGFYVMNAMMPGGGNRMQMSYFSDYGYKGEVKVGDRMVPAVLDDAGCTGDMRLSSDTWRNPLLWLDLNGDGKPDGRTETVVPPRPFEADGKWWKVSGITADAMVTVVPGEKPAAPAKPAGPALSAGQKAPAFTGKTVDGKDVKFPDDFKGKLVLIDFWATWCGPCLAEVPNVVAAYQKYHGQGLEVLGISLDREQMEEKITALTKAKGMTWQQVYDGGHWGAATAKLYGIHSIPHMMLVDGDTGTIIRNKDIRGPELAKAIEKALADRKK